VRGVSLKLGPEEPTSHGRDVGYPAWGAWMRARAWQTNVALGLIGIEMWWLARQLVREYDHFTIGFSGVSGWGAWLYVLAMVLILTQPMNRWTMPIILAVAVACRMEVVFANPLLSSDIYRYVWDGVVQHAGISPYRYVPGDAALSFLRAPNSEVFAHINRRDYAHTIYPPLAQMLFYVVTWISPTVTAMKLAMVGFEAVTVAALIALLKKIGRSPAQVLLYAWCPLLVWEIAGSGHLDAAAMAFIALALLARMRRRPLLTGVLLGIAVMVKFYPLVLLPALWWRGDRRGSWWKMPAGVAAVVAVGYAYYAGVGMRVFGFMGGYAQEEGLATGARYFLLDLALRAPGMAEMPVWVFYLFCAVVFAGLAAWAWRVGSQRGHEFIGPAFGLAMALMLLFSPHYAWYVIWLIPFFALQPNLAVLVYLMGFFYGYTTMWAAPGPKMFLLNEWLYGATALGFLVWMTWRKWERSFFPAMGYEQ
jgi:alpha-1,6-mannosyltransferase